MERITQLSQHHALDNKFRLIYGDRMDKRLLPCEPIIDDELTLGIIDNKKINPNRLLLLPKDRESIKITKLDDNISCAILHPGKSAKICFTPKGCGPEIVKDFVTKDIAGNYDRRDHLHISTVAKIKDAGWTPVWAPLQLLGRILHVRMIAQRTIESGHDPILEDAVNLSRAFTLEI